MSAVTRDLTKAWLQVLNTTLAGMATPRAAYEWDKAPRSGADYAVLRVERTVGGSASLDGVLATQTWRLVVGATGKGRGNAEALLDKAVEALEYALVTVAGRETTGAMFDGVDTDPEPDEDDTSLFYGEVGFTFAY